MPDEQTRQPGRVLKSSTGRRRKEAPKEERRFRALYGTLSTKEERAAQRRKADPDYVESFGRIRDEIFVFSLSPQTRTKESTLFLRTRDKSAT